MTLDTRAGSKSASRKTHRDLIAWQASMQLLVESYRVAAQLPDIERYGLASQLRRSAVSIPANIAEGFGRSARGDYLRHLSIASGSLRELQTLLEAVTLLRYLDEPATKVAESASRRTAFMLHRLQRSLSAR
jgi:four helix bundle protein